MFNPVLPELYHQTLSMEFHERMLSGLPFPSRGSFPPMDKPCLWAILIVWSHGECTHINTYIYVIYMAPSLCKRLVGFDDFAKCIKKYCKLKFSCEHINMSRKHIDFPYLQVLWPFLEISNFLIVKIWRLMCKISYSTWIQCKETPD